MFILFSRVSISTLTLTIILSSMKARDINGSERVVKDVRAILQSPSESDIVKCGFFEIAYSIFRPRSYLEIYII
uniref:Uncharacterized protein n=1 Tax=Rhizophagus irregularis (strain DAOM 181602 / DAOM 197198 / MUCL 43194) TaxID=747089 RepID=U9SKE1_RHIID